MVFALRLFPFGNSCAFCLMLSTRGFEYFSRTSAGEDKGRYHAHCHCKIAASKKGIMIDGYDPEGLDYRIHQVAQELCISDFNWQDYMRNPAMQAMLQKEIRLRDKDWLLNDKPPAYTQEPHARPLQKEKDIADKLSSQG